MNQRSNASMEESSDVLREQWPSGKGAGFPIQGT